MFFKNVEICINETNLNMVKEYVKVLEKYIKNEAIIDVSHSSVEFIQELMNINWSTFILCSTNKNIIRAAENKIEGIRILKRFNRPRAEYSDNSVMFPFDFTKEELEQTEIKELFKNSFNFEVPGISLLDRCLIKFDYNDGFYFKLGENILIENGNISRLLTNLLKSSVHDSVGTYGLCKECAAKKNCYMDIQKSIQNTGTPLLNESDHLCKFYMSFNTKNPDPIMAILHNQEIINNKLDEIIDYGKISVAGTELLATLNLKEVHNG
jgi:hypothetical protein